VFDESTEQSAVGGTDLVIRAKLDSDGAHGAFPYEGVDRQYGTLELFCLKSSPLNSRCKVLLRPDDLCAELESGRKIGSDEVAGQRSGMRLKSTSAPHCPLAQHL
jgi:hypothetical protein